MTLLLLTLHIIATFTAGILLMVLLEADLTRATMAAALFLLLGEGLVGWLCLYVAPPATADPEREALRRGGPKGLEP